MIKQFNKGPISKGWSWLTSDDHITHYTNWDIFWEWKGVLVIIMTDISWWVCDYFVLMFRNHPTKTFTILTFFLGVGGTLLRKFPYTKIICVYSTQTRPPWFPWCIGVRLLRDEWSVSHSFSFFLPHLFALRALCLSRVSGGYISFKAFLLWPSPP